MKWRACQANGLPRSSTLPKPACGDGCTAPARSFDARSRQKTNFLSEGLRRSELQLDRTTGDRSRDGAMAMRILENRGSILAKVWFASLLSACSGPVEPTDTELVTSAQG